MKIKRTFLQLLYLQISLSYKKIKKSIHNIRTSVEILSEKI